MKRLCLIILFLLISVPLAFAQFGGSPFSAASHVLTGDLTLENGEIIDNSTDGIVCLQGAGGTNNEDICFDLEGASVPIIGTTTGASIIFEDNIRLFDLVSYRLGTSDDVYLIWETTGNDSFQIGTTVGAAAGSGYISIMEKADMGNANRSPDADWANGATPADPTFCLNSSDGTNKLDHGCQWHDQTDYHIATGTGSILLAPAKTTELTVESNGIRTTPPAAQTIAAGNTIAADACGGIKQITADGAVTTDTTNTFTAPAATNTGCCMTIINVGAQNITLDNNANFLSIGGADIVMTANDSTQVCSNGTDWYSTGGLVAN